MNPWQVAQQIKHKLQQAVWPTGAGEVVFGAQEHVVAILADTPRADQIPRVYPAAIVLMGDGEPDEEHPTLIRHTFRVITGAKVFGDPKGEFAIIGAGSSNLGDSANRGVAEVAERVRATCESVTGANGQKLLMSGTATGPPFAVNLSQVAFADDTFSALCTSGLHYAAPQVFRRNSGETHWIWEGAHCSDRFDFYRYVLVEKTGSFSSSPSDGTEIYTGTAATFEHSPTSGRYYTVFAEYSARDGTSATSADGNSDALIGTYKQAS